MSGAFLRRRDRTARSLRVVHYSSAVNITALLRTEGWHVNAKRVQRIWWREG